MNIIKNQDGSMVIETKKTHIENKKKALVKDLEKQIDYLVGYSPQGLHWKQEYHFREELIGEALVSDNTPEDIREKINRLLESVYTLRTDNEVDEKQPYLKYSETVLEKETIPVAEEQNNTIDLKQLRIKRKLEREWLKTFTYQGLSKWLDEKSKNHIRTDLLIREPGKWRVHDQA